MAPVNLTNSLNPTTTPNMLTPVILDSPNTGINPQLFNPFFSNQNPPQNTPPVQQNTNLSAFNLFSNNQDLTSNQNHARPFAQSDNSIPQNPNISLQNSNNNNPFTTSAPPILPPRPYSIKNPFLPQQQQQTPPQQQPITPFKPPPTLQAPAPQQTPPQQQPFNPRFSLPVTNSSYPNQVSPQPQTLFPIPPSQNQYPAQFMTQQAPNNNAAFNQRVTMDDFFAGLERSTTTGVSINNTQSNSFNGVPTTHNPSLSSKPLPPPPNAKRGRSSIAQPDTKDPFDPFA